MANRLILCIGTKKGLFVAEASKTRRRFALRGPFGPGVAVYSALIDTRGTPRLYASSCNAFFGMKVLRSTDLGKNFNIRIGGRDVNRLCRTFAEAEPNELFAVEGSTGYIEIALNQGAAADRLKVVQGAEIEVETGVLNH